MYKTYKTEIDIIRVEFYGYALMEGMISDVYRCESCAAATVQKLWG